MGFFSSRCDQTDPVERLTGHADHGETITLTLFIRRRGGAVIDTDLIGGEPPRTRRRMSRDEFTSRFGAD